MGTIVLMSGRPPERRRLAQSRTTANDVLPRVLAALIAAGQGNFALEAVSAWGRQEVAADELLDLCQTYAAVAGLREQGDAWATE